MGIVLALVAALSVPWAMPQATPRGPVVILAPHPDDETLGCGGLIARRVHEGRRVVVVVITDGRALLKRFGVVDPTPAQVSRLRKDETVRAVEILGGRANDIRFLDFENERLVEQKGEALARISALLTELAPSEVYFPSPFEGHAEHVVTHEIARAACAATRACPATFEFVVNLKRGVTLETLPRRLHPVDVSSHRDREQRALAQFRSHLDTLYKGQTAPLADNYDRYLTAEEPFLVEP